MRNPERIRHVLYYINSIWNHVPDMRFNQLMDYLQNEYNDYKNQSYSKVLWEKEVNEKFAIELYRKTLEVDLFYVEDEDFIEFLKKTLDELNK